MRRLAGLCALLVIAACGDTTNSSTGVIAGPVINPPTGVTYFLEPVGSGTIPTGILLRWDFDTSSALAVWNVYGRQSVADAWGLRGQTTSPSFHDVGNPELQYTVTATDVYGNETAPGNIVTINEALALQAPESLTTTALDSGVALVWADNAFNSDPQNFVNYRVYSAAYNLDAQTCGTWGLEGTTISPEFVAGVLPNGEPRCFAVSAIDTLGYESLWSNTPADTPRPDARDIVVYAEQAQEAGSAFRFWQDSNSDGLAEQNEIGLLFAGSNPAADFSIQRDGSNNLQITPVRTGTSVQSVGAITDVNDIHFAPASGYSTSQVQAAPGTGYIFQMSGGDGFERYGAIRVSHVGLNFLILDWSYQTDPGNPMLTGRPAVARIPQPKRR